MLMLPPPNYAGKVIFKQSKHRRPQDDNISDGKVVDGGSIVIINRFGAELTPEARVSGGDFSVQSESGATHMIYYEDREMGTPRIKLMNTLLGMVGLRPNARK